MKHKKLMLLPIRSDDWRKLVTSPHPLNQPDELATAIMMHRIKGADTPSVYVNVNSFTGIRGVVSLPVFMTIAKAVEKVAKTNPNVIVIERAMGGLRAFALAPETTKERIVRLRRAERIVRLRRAASAAAANAKRWRHTHKQHIKNAEAYAASQRRLEAALKKELAKQPKKRRKKKK